MNDGLKKIGKWISTLLAVIVALPLLLSLVLQIPAVQNFVVHQAAEFASRALETTVSIGRVDIGLFGKVKVQQFYVEDYQRDTLLYVGRVDAFITGLGLFGGGIELSRGEVVDAKLYLRETPDGEMNIKQVVDRLSDPNKPKKGNFRLRLYKASIKNMDFCLERLNRKNPEFGIDFGHLHLLGIKAFIDDLSIDGQSISTTIQTLSARERSGFELDHLSGRFFLTSGCLGFEQMSIVTPRSNISIPYISLVGNSWAAYKDFVGEVRVDARLNRTTVATDDIAYFAPKLHTWHTTFYDTDIAIAGEVDNLTAQIHSMQIGDQTYLTAEASVKGLPDIRKTTFDLSLTRLSTTAAAADQLAGGITGRPLPPNLVQMLGNSGRIDLTGHFKGALSSFDLQLGVSSSVGSVSCNLQMSPLKGGLQSIRGNVATRDLRLGKLLGKSTLLGDATLRAHINGVVGKNYANANVSGEVSRFGFKGYVYDSLKLKGRLRNKGFDGVVTARDPNLDFDFAGLVDFNDAIPQYDFTLDLRRADLAALHINPRDSVSQLSAHVEAKGSGRSLDDMNGTIRILDGVYKHNDRELRTKNIELTGVNSAESKLVELRSDFADARFQSRTSYREVFEYLRASAWKYLPMLHRQDTPRSVMPTALVDDYSVLTVDIRKFNPIADAISPGLQVADSSQLRLLFNPVSNQLSFQASSEFIERRNLLATRLKINAHNAGDSLTLSVQAEDLYAGALHLPQLRVFGGAKNGLMQLSTGFNDTVRRFSGLLNLRAGITSENSDAGRVIDLRILPSRITSGNTTWQIFAHKILLDTTQVVIDKFFIMNSGQEFLLNGTASRRADDSVTLTLRNFDLAPFSQVVDRMGYGIGGVTNGEATMKAVLRGGEIAADIRVDSLTVNGIPGPPLRLTSQWDLARNRASLAVTNRVKRDTLIRGFYAPDQVRYYAKLSVDSLDMGLLDPILSGVIYDTKGLAKADLVLQGQHRNADLRGKIRVKGLTTTVDFTKVTYTMPDAELDVQNNRFRAVNVPMFDQLGNPGRFDFDLSLQHLSNISYEVKVAPQHMLVLNTTEKDNGTFFGHVFATGSARIAGDKGNVYMNISATTDDKSTFSLPLSNKANISYADFVTFQKPILTDTTDDLAARKRAFERQRKQKEKGASQMNIALSLNVLPNLEMQLSVAGNTIRARGEGALNLQINPKSNVFEMYGDYTISEGSFLFSLQNIINKKFIIERGSTIVWTGSPVNAMLNIEAIYKLKASLQPLLQTSTQDNAAADRSVPVECIIHLGSRLTNPTVTFNVHVPSSDPETAAVIANSLNTPESMGTQFLYLLVFNSFMSDNAAASANLGASVSAAAGLEFLSSQLSNWLSNDDYNIIIRYRPSSNISSDEVDFGLSTSLINNRLFVEVEGNYLIDNKQAVKSTMSNFMGEAYITYLIDRAGTLKLKAFTQTIDRFDENQGLQETGIGIYYKEDFNNFRDFRQRVKERFSNKKRKARREAEQTAAKLAADSLRRQQTPAAGEETNTNNSKQILK